jgi:hypothetical protein
MQISMNIPGAIDISTRPKRRKALSLLISELSRIRGEEEAYMLRIPINLQSGAAYAAADECVDILTGAIIALGDAYYT